MMVANLVPRKGILDFLKELLAQQDAWGEFNVQIVGSFEINPVYARACQKFVATHPHLDERIQWTGALPHPEVLQLYPQNHVFISTAHMETFGMAIQEAKEMGLPLLVLNAGYAAQHIQEGKNGYGFAEMKELVRALLAFSRNQSAREALKRTAWEHRSGSAYTWDDAAQKFITLVDQLTTPGS